MPAGRAPALMLGVVLILAAAAAGQDTDADGLDDEEELDLARQFAPVLRLHPRESFYPVAVRYALGNSQLRRATEEANETVNVYPSAESIGALTDPEERYFLDNTHGGIDDDGVREHFTSVKEYMPPTAYARVTQTADGFTVVQYWFYYPFNDGPLNRHEGDWEMIQVIVKDGEPTGATYSQHFAGQSAEWSDVLLRDGHPVVYVALGSHANYFRSYQGVLGLHSDAVSGRGPTLTPDSYEIVPLGELDAHDPSEDWLAFAGRWGEWGEYEDALMGRRGPFGPAYGDNAEKWEAPLLWDLEVAKLNPGWLWASWLTANFTLLFLVYLFLRLAWTFIGLGRAFRARSAFGAFGLGAVLAILGAAVVVLAVPEPWYSLKLSIPEGEYRTDGYVTVVRMDGVGGLQVNNPQSNRGLVSLTAAKLPIGLLFVSAFAFLVLDSVKASKARDLRRRLLGSGIERLLVPLVPILLVVLFLGSIVSFSAESLLDGKVPEAVDEMIDSMQSSPLFGSYQGEIAHLGQVRMRWGLGLGSIMMLLGGALQLLGGLAAGAREIR